MTTDRDAIAGTTGQVQTLRLSRKAYGGLLLAAVAVGASMTLGRDREYGAPWRGDIRVGIAIAGVLAVLATVYYLNARVWSDGRAVHRRDFFRRVHTVPHADVARVVLAPRLRLSGRIRLQGLVAFLDHNGDALLRLTGRQWTTDQLCDFAGVTGAPVDRRDDVERARDLRDDQPGALPFLERRPWVLWAVIGGRYLLVVVAVLLVFSLD